MTGNATYRVNILLGILLFLAAAGVQEQFANCSKSDTGFCFHGICRRQTSEDVLSCLCSTGFVGDRCQHFDLLAVLSEDPDTRKILIFVMIPVLITSMGATVCLCTHLCRCLICRIDDCASTDGNIL